MLLLLGVSTVVLAVTVAIGAPAETYELSLYGSTPSMVWIGVAIGLTVAVSVAFAAESRRVRGLATFLGAFSAITVYALPALRGYYFYGTADSLTHVGIARDIASGRTSALEVIYPLEHLLAVVFHEFVNMSLHQALFAATLLFPVLFIGSTALLFRAITDDPQLQVIGTFSAMLFLPLNLIGMYPYPFPSAQAAFFVPVVLYLFVLWLWEDTVGTLAAVGCGFLALLLLHPQQTMSLLLLFGGLLTADTFVRYRVYGALPTNLGRVSLMYGGMIVALFGWSIPHDLFVWASSSLFEQLLTPDGPTYVSAKAGAIVAIADESLLVFFLKLFGVSFTYVLVTGVVVLLALKSAIGRLSTRYRTPSQFNQLDRIHVLLVISVTPVIGLATLYLISGDNTNQAFRYIGFSSVVLTVTGAIGLHRLLSATSRVSRHRAKLIVGPIVLIFLLSSVMTVHPSPYLVTGSAQVTESQVVGFQSAFEYQEDEVLFTETYVSAGVYRYVDYHYGHRYEGTGQYVKAEGYSPVDDHYYDRSLQTTLDRRYITLTCTGRQVNTKLYDGARFSLRDFKYIETEPGIDNPISTGCFDLYRVG
jgi:hypothetical protein